MAVSVTGPHAVNELGCPGKPGAFRLEDIKAQQIGLVNKADYIFRRMTRQINCFLLQK